DVRQVNLTYAIARVGDLKLGPLGVCDACQPDSCSLVRVAHGVGHEVEQRTAELLGVGSDWRRPGNFQLPVADGQAPGSAVNIAQDRPRINLLHLARLAEQHSAQQKHVVDVGRYARELLERDIERLTHFRRARLVLAAQYLQVTADDRKGRAQLM